MTDWDGVLARELARREWKPHHCEDSTVHGQLGSVLLAAGMTAHTGGDLETMAPVSMCMPNRWMGWLRSMPPPSVIWVLDVVGAERKESKGDAINRG